MEKKARSRIPPDRAAEVLFLHDHTCCICNEPGKPVQIHHINDNPADHRLENLAVLCLHDHDRTQTNGGFGRHLGNLEVIKFRDSWVRFVEQRHERSSEGTVTSTYSLRDSEPRLPDSLLAPFISSLPASKSAVRGRARVGWDSGISAEMNRATYEAIDAFESLWLILSRWFPENHFDRQPADKYVRAYVADRFVWHRAINQPEGEGTSGSILGQLASGGVLGDLDVMIANTVEALWFWNQLDEIDLVEWRQNWRLAGDGD